MSERTCVRCKETRPIEMFGMLYGVPNARSFCKSCAVRATQKCRARHLEAYREKANQHRRSLSPERRHEINVRRRETNPRYKEQRKEWRRKSRERDFIHWRSVRGSFLTELELWQLWGLQDGKCALTGRPLDGKAHIDHIIPKSRGGQNTFENARWVCREANTAKFDLLDEDLLKLCYDIIATLGPKLAEQGKSDVA